MQPGPPEAAIDIDSDVADHPHVSKRFEAAMAGVSLSQSARKSTDLGGSP